MTHKKKDCLEVKWLRQFCKYFFIVLVEYVFWLSLLSQQRPRKVGARFTGTSIAPDEHFQVELDLDYDGKRDRWNGYDPEEHQRIVEEYAKVDLVSYLSYLIL